ncbi:MAG: glycosyltransferase [Nitrospirae bacterium]|nr:MAG: glycosyltransferase [Nitrospirota bacterium]
MYSSAELTISIIVPVYNGGANFRRCLVSLLEALPPPTEIIVVADGDTDGSGELAKEFGAQVLRFPSPGGPGRARNLGARAAESDLLFFVDADVTIPPDAVGQVVTVFKRDPYLAALFGSYDDEPGETNFLSQYRNLLHHYVHQTGGEDASTFWGACGAIRRDVFLAMGGFVEHYYKPSIEDIELGCRLRRAGHRIRLCKSLQIKHWKRWEVVAMLKADFFQRALPWTELILSDRNFINDLNTGMSGRLSVILTFGLLSSLALTSWHSQVWAVAGLMALLLLTLNAPLYRFFIKKRGLRFALQAIPWHWLYFFYSGLAFAIGTTRHMLSHGRDQGRPASLVSLERPHSGSRSE